MEYRDIHRQIKLFNARKDDVAPIAELLEHENCAADSALMVYWKLDGPWYYTDEQAEQSPHKDLLIKLRDRLISGHYKTSDIDFRPVSAMKVSLVQAMKFQNAGIHENIMRN